MTRDFIPFSKPSISEEAINAVAEVLRSGWITTGPNCARFEEDICRYTGAKNAIALSSATAGMHIALKALNIGPGDEVITPSMTWVSTVNLIELAGATPVFCDVNKDTLMVEAKDIEPLITEKTKLIIPVHYAGAPVDLDKIRRLAKKHKIKIIEDAAHAIGTEYKGEAIGRHGTAIFSFHPIKNITTCEGGVIVTDDDELATQLKQLKFHGLGVDAFDRETQGRAPQAEVLTPGYKYNMTDVSAVIGIHQLAKLDKFNSKRRNLSKHYNKLLKDIPGIIPLEHPKYDHKHATHLYIVRVDDNITGVERNTFMEELKKVGVGTGLHFKAVHLHKYYRENSTTQRGDLPKTEWNSDRICSLPLFPDMTLDDIDYIVDKIRQII
ncbi:MAG: aminotransferase class I/II-fold pyridoxal phosphate-dependent enzyme [Kiritimatiellae bacterium]|jgi:UDP-4-amino-4-deoxy-L-arabinose-oxoglutarate aminotransferase|nr:aminotransferase class I/II-fold pyridoxal phosphate-dependent enzyme [Kiritimatiellia bacterium]